jgi:hypothetical protein
MQKSCRDVDMLKITFLSAGKVVYLCTAGYSGYEKKFQNLFALYTVL